ncbi:SWIM zinc finger family protein [Terrabacter sp. Root85]|uniref:SWIM zinc finger family protein n=1 Tax=Terrabacter sp. Root85 TaxID=1736603 RepID=UPI001F4641AA|nr:SWIM zinc finger family protein [Terrabacter sp. Root85]
MSIDLTGPAFRCSCPSRKFPCKHGLALLLLWVDGSGSVAEATEVAGFAQEWAAERSARAEAKAAGDAARPARTPDPAAAAKRLEERLALMDDGMDDFARWLTDLARSGTAAARHQSYAWWDGTAARLVDAQLPGLADDVRSVGGAVSGRPDWAERLLVALGRWWTATRAWSGRESLDEARLGDLRAYLGWSTSTESVRRADAVADRWLVLGAHRSDDGRLQQQRTWLRGSATGETVQVLDFAAGGQVLPVPRVVGSGLDATLARYPGAAVRRALFVDEPTVSDGDVRMPSGASLADARSAAAEAWGRNPWARRIPVVLSDVRVGVDRVVDADGASVSLTDDADVWSLLGLTGGGPARVFGELEETRLRPLTVVLDGEVVGL